jgi:hypothetical protein
VTNGIEALGALTLGIAYFSHESAFVPSIMSPEVMRWAKTSSHLQFVCESHGEFFTLLNAHEFFSDYIESEDQCRISSFGTSIEHVNVSIYSSGFANKSFATTLVVHHHYQRRVS